MRSWMCRIALSLPVMIVLGFTEDVRAQHRTWAAGIGVGVGVYGGPGFGPYWGPAWGFMPNYTYFNGSWGNGLSMYGPPVPTGKPVPGMFGGGDSRFFAPPPLYPGWLYGVYIPLNQPATLPRGVWRHSPARACRPPRTNCRDLPKLCRRLRPFSRTHPRWKSRCDCRARTLDSSLMANQPSRQAPFASSPHQRKRVSKC